jgi:hypothetical protein
MAGRPKNPNRPPTVTAVRVTERTMAKLIKEHAIFGGKEPYNNTIERALDELILLRKKVKALNDENLGLAEEVNQFIINNKRLLKIQKQQAEQISKYENELLIKVRS